MNNPGPPTPPDGGRDPAQTNPWFEQSPSNQAPPPPQQHFPHYGRVPDQNIYHGEFPVSANPQFMPAPTPYPATAAPRSNGTVLPVIIIAILTVALVGVVAYGFLWGPWRTGSSPAAAPPQETTVSVVTATSTMPAEPAIEERIVVETTTIRPTPVARPVNPGLPASAIPANNSARSSADSGRFDNAYRGSSVTSEPFANAVHSAFLAYYRDTGRTEGTIRAYSPVTELTYDMSCSDNGDYVTCAGGNNAVVYIS